MAAEEYTAITNHGNLDYIYAREPQEHKKSARRRERGGKKGLQGKKTLSPKTTDIKDKMVS